MKKIATLVLTSMLAMTVASCSPATPSTTAAGTAAGTTTAATTAAGTTTAATTAAATSVSVEDPKATITVQAEETWMEYYQAAVDSLKTK